MSPVERTPGTLWIVATPIGTIADLSPRAAEVMAGATTILAEDTRRARSLLGRIGVAATGRLLSFHEHNEDRRLERVLDVLRTGGSVVLMSDAGTPVLSDPGFGLVRAVRREALPVASVPGPSSFTAALAASGQPPLPATLVGFLPARAAARRRRIEELSGVAWTLVVLLSPHRLAAELQDLAAGLGRDRPATLLAELSKRFERAVTATLGELAVGGEVARPRGEYVLVVGPDDRVEVDRGVDARQIREAYDDAIAAGLPRTRAIRAAADRLGVGRREVFDSLVGHETEDEED
ncbi:MAG: 16S rRNA (cytidine(1402)-2'-O)-methyltransferase [Thermoanaerobaculales bacterium]|nr:16S rRNA (cytidine(1402)-2'-O)-methyltransferase [Thermoanaerobaculales bacterium]